MNTFCWRIVYLQYLAYILMSVAHHHMMVGHTLEDFSLCQHAGPLSSKTVTQLFRRIVALHPQPQSDPLNKFQTSIGWMSKYKYQWYLSKRQETLQVAHGFQTAALPRHSRWISSPCAGHSFLVETKGKVVQLGHTL